MQIISLGRSSITLKEDSPVWACKLNGKPLNIQHMDAAYIEEIRRWFNTPSMDLGWLQEAHDKTKAASLLYAKERHHEVQL